LGFYKKKRISFYRDNDIETDELDFLEVDSPPYYEFEIEPSTCVADFQNEIPKDKINDIKTVND
jgi:hypothetical protein